jgi:hypothetical protein
LGQELLIFADQSEHRAQSFMRDYFALMRMRQFVELPVSEISPIVSDLDATTPSDRVIQNPPDGIGNGDPVRLDQARAGLFPALGLNAGTERARESERQLHHDLLRVAPEVRRCARIQQRS